MIHVTIQQLSSCLDRQLAADSEALVRRHVESCSDCASKLSALERADRALTRALTHDPGEGFVERLAAEVEFLIGGGRREREVEGAAASTPPARQPSGADARRPRLRVLSEREPAPPRPAPSAAAAVSGRPGLIGAGAMRSPAQAPVPTARPVRAPEGLHPRAEKREPRPMPWGAVAFFAILAGSAGLTVTNSETVTQWLDSLVGVRTPGLAPVEPNRPVGAPPAGAPAAQDLVGVPIGDPSAAPETDPASGGPAGAVPAAASERGTPAPAAPKREHADESPLDEPSHEPAQGRSPSGDDGRASVQGVMPARVGSNDPFASLRAEMRTPVRKAERLEGEAALDPSAARYEGAAAAWERAIEGMGGLPEQVAARGRLADARYRAWELEPDAVRADAARQALRSYLLFAPAGLEREEAKRRLSRIEAP